MARHGSMYARLMAGAGDQGVRVEGPTPGAGRLDHAQVRARMSAHGTRLGHQKFGNAGCQLNKPPPGQCPHRRCSAQRRQRPSRSWSLAHRHHPTRPARRNCGPLQSACTTWTSATTMPAAFPQRGGVHMYTLMRTGPTKCAPEEARTLYAVPRVSRIPAPRAPERPRRNGTAPSGFMPRGGGDDERRHKP